MGIPRQEAPRQHDKIKQNDRRGNQIWAMYLAAKPGTMEAYKLLAAFLSLGPVVPS